MYAKCPPFWAYAIRSLFIRSRICSVYQSFQLNLSGYSLANLRDNENSVFLDNRANRTFVFVLDHISQGQRSTLSYPPFWKTHTSIHSIQMSSTEFLSLGKENLTKLIKFKVCYPTYVRYKYRMYIVVARHFSLVGWAKYKPDQLFVSGIATLDLSGN